MAGLPFNLPPKTRADVQQFVGWASVADVDWRTWRKPEGVTMAYIMAVGGGGGGGTGVIGANSNAAGGGGGGSGGQSTLLIPAFMLPDVLYICAGAAKVGPGLASRVSIYPNVTSNHLVLSANGGAVGGNAGGASAGGLGPGASIQSIGLNPIAGRGTPFFLAGANGVAGGGASGSIPTSGLICTGGTGGASLGAAGSNGGASGQINTPSSPTRFPTQPGATAITSATTRPNPGNPGFVSFMAGFLQCYGATGGGSTHGSATGAGLVQARGGDGVGYGCGGGGMGGALTGSTPAVQSLGGPGYVCIISW
jgi:hypothetical protein